MRTVSVVIPWRDDTLPRARALQYVYQRYQAFGWQVEIGQMSGAWRKADAIEDALSRSTGDVLVVADADCWSDNIVQAVDRSEIRPWVIPYRKVFRLTEESSDRMLAGLEPDRTWETQRRHDGIVGGGIVVLPRELYDRVPLDRRFVGWGGEDHSWGVALSCLVGPPSRLLGVCWHLWHPPQPDAPSAPGSQPVGVCGSGGSEFLRQQYQAAERDPIRMRALVQGARMRGNATVSILSGTTGTDVYGDPATTTVTETSVQGAVVAPAAGEEQTDRGRTGDIRKLTVYLPAGTDVSHTDRLRIDGDVYEISTPPQFWASAFSGTPQGVVVDVEKAVG